MFYFFISWLRFLFLLGLFPFIGSGGREISSGTSFVSKKKESKKKSFSFFKKFSAKEVQHLMIQGQSSRIFLVSRDSDLEEKGEKTIVITVSCRENIKEEDVLFASEENGKKLCIKDNRRHVKEKITPCVYDIKIPPMCKISYEFCGGQVTVYAEKIEGNMKISAGQLFLDAKKSLLDAIYIIAGRAKVFLGKIKEKIFLNCGYGYVKIKEGPYTTEHGSISQEKIPVVSVSQASGSFVIKFPEETSIFFPDFKRNGVYSSFMHSEKSFQTKIFLFTPSCVKAKVLFSDKKRKKENYYEKTKKIYKQ